MNEITGLMLKPESPKHRERYGDDLRDRRYLDPKTVLLEPTRSNALLIAKRENTVVREEDPEMEATISMRIPFH